jgi:ribosomal protein S18 acetylase RimI-like enzyme
MKPIIYDNYYWQNDLVSLRAVEEDGLLRNIALMEASAWGEPCDPQSIASRRLRIEQQLTDNDSQHHAMFAATDSDDVVGVCRIKRCADDPETWLIYGLAVHSNHRRQGIGRSLFSACTEYACQHGAVTIRSQTHEDNQASRALHEAMGLRPGYHSMAEDGDRLITFEIPIPRVSGHDLGPDASGSR